MADKLILAFRDYDNTRQQVSFEISAAATEPQRTALIDGLQFYSIGGSDGAWLQVEKEPAVGVPALSPVAQNSTMLIIEMEDSVSGKIYRDRLPQPYLTMPDDGGTPAWIKVGTPPNSLTVANPDHASYTTYLKTPLEAIWVSPEGNAGTLQRAYIES